MTASAPGAAQTFRWRRRSVLPGFSLSLGYTVAYLSLIVLGSAFMISVLTSH